MTNKISRRDFLMATGISALGGLLAACTTEVVKTVEVEKIVKETSVVKETVKEEVIVEVTAAAPTGPTNSRGVVLPADALPLEQQNWSIGDRRCGRWLWAYHGIALQPHLRAQRRLRSPDHAQHQF